jgi:LCP family protein required for cell wall assembly
MLKKITIVFIIIFLIGACNLPSTALVENITQSRQIFWITKGPNGNATPTPFMPLAAIMTEEIPTATPTRENTPVAPTTTATNDGSQRPAGQVNILILGSDYREGRGFRTDVFMLLSLYPNEGTASILSFPRDLYVYIPGVGDQRINVAQPYGGFELTKATLEQNFGVTADHYIMTNFNGFKSIIDSLGGINVEVGNYLSDSCDLPQQDAAGYCTVYEGTTYMNGETALWYVRSRYSTSDLDRTRRAQEVVFAMFSKLMSLDAVSRIPELYAAYSNALETDLTVGDIAPLAPLATTILNDSSKFRRYAIGINQVTPYILPNSGANVLLPNYEAIAELIKQSAFTP